MVQNVYFIFYMTQKNKKQAGPAFRISQCFFKKLNK